MTNDNAPKKSFYHRYLLVAGTVVLFLLVWYAAGVLLLGFAGILLSIFLRSLADFISRLTKLSGGWSLAIVVVSLLVLIGASVWFVAPNVAEQIDNLTESLPRAVQRLQEKTEKYRWGKRVLEQMPPADELMPDRSDAFAKATGVFSTTLSALTNFVIIIFVGLYLAAEPKTYLKGINHLVPLDKRRRATEVLEATGSGLRWWLIGKVGSMLVIGVLTTLGLWLLDVPLALTLGLLAALLTFIPNIGPLLSLVPAALLALLDSPTKAIYVILLYLAIQTVESYLLTPLVQKRTISVPPALTIMAQVLMGVLTGGIGLVLATPLTAAAFVITKMLYVEDTLGDESISENNKN